MIKNFRNLYEVHACSKYPVASSHILRFVSNFANIITTFRLHYDVNKCSLQNVSHNTRNTFVREFLQVAVSNDISSYFDHFFFLSPSFLFKSRLFVSVLSSAIGFGQSGKRIPRPGEGKWNPGRGHATDPSHRCKSLLLPYREQTPWRGALRDRFERERNGRAEGTASSKLRETA